MSEETDRLREREELTSALQNFAEHFGAAEVYEQARAIYLASAGGKAAIESEAASSWEAVLRETNRPISERQKRNSSGTRSSQGSSSVEAAKRALGG